ncbi:MAG: ribokinase [Planctomycetes bacterium]|nr:ribokinase [Planctomycetota bacterium]
MRTIAVIGSINMDLVVGAATLPRPGETVLGSEFRVVCGGKGANQAVAAARLGGRVHMVGCVGTDEYGRIARKNLAASGVGVRAVRKVAGATGVALIVVDAAGRNLIAVAPNANAQVRVPRRAFDIVVMQLETPFAFPHARCFILNPAPARLDAIRSGARSRRRPLEGVDFVIPNEHEAKSLTGCGSPARAARELRRMGARRAIITLGEAGVFDDSTGRTHPAIRVRAVDTVGAGDAFVGAFAAAIAADRDDPIRFAQAAAAIKCTRRGAQSVPSAAEVDRLLAHRPLRKERFHE